MQFIKSNSCLLAFDNSPSFSTGEKLGLFFADFLQNVDFDISPPRTQSKQIGSQELGVNSINFSPDIALNLSYFSREDFRTDNLLGSLFRPSGAFISPFSGVRGFSFNSYLFFSEQQSNDLIGQIIRTNSFSGVNVISLGNCYLTNQNLSFAAGQLPRTSCSLIASNIVSQSLVGNYMQIPAINLESGTTGGAATIFLDPGQVSRIQTGNASGILKTWAATFQPTFDNLQLPNQPLVSAVVNKMDISFSIDRENAYGFGSDHVFGRDIKYPIQGSISINGVVNSYNSGDFSALMRSEDKYNIQIFNRDPQDAYLSGLSNAEISGLNKLDHLTKNRWLKFDNCILRDKKDSLSVNQLFEYANQFDVSITENRGLTFKQGEEHSLDDVFLHSNDFHKCVSRDGYSPTHNPFLQYFEQDCSLANLLSSDKKILLTRDNYIEDALAISCPYSGQSGDNLTPGYIYRWDASLIEGVNGEQINTFPDSYGLNDGIQSGINRATLNTSIQNGLNALYFDENQGYNLTSPIPNYSGYTVCLVAKPNSNNINYGVLGNLESSYPFVEYYIDDSLNIEMDAANQTSLTYAYDSFPVTGWNVFQFAHQGDNLIATINQTTLANSGNIPIFTTGNFSTIVTQWNSATFNGTQHIGEIIFYPSGLSLSGLMNNFEVLSGKWGI